MSSGEAIYRDKMSKNTSFSFKQFANAQHDYNETLMEGDLVSFGGKFTVDEQKLLLVVEMACKIEPRTNQDGEFINWEPSQIPPSKPFIKIVTSSYEPITTFNNMRFIKTRSLIYTPFHKEARYVNFEIGYSKEAKWLEFISDKWANFANFFVAGFFEAAYTTMEKGLPVTYVQIDAKIIDYDPRFRHPSPPTNNISASPSRSSTNIFAQKRNETSSGNSPSTPKPTISRNDSIIMEDAQEERSDDDSNKEYAAEISQDPVMVSTPTQKSRKRQLSDLCDMIDEPDQPEPVINEPKQPHNKRGGHRGRGGRGSRGGRGKK